MSGFTQEDLDENIAKKMRLIQAGQEYVADCDRLGMKTVDKFLAIAKSNAGSNHANENAWKATMHLSTVTVRAARGSPYGSSASMPSSGYSTPMLRDVLLPQLQNSQRMSGSPIPTDDQSSYSGAQLPPTTPDKLDELIKMTKFSTEKLEQLSARMDKFEAKKKKKKP